MTLSNTKCRNKLTGRIVISKSPPGTRRGGFLAFGGADMDETHWTPKLVEARFEEAADTLRRLPSVKVQGYFNTWPPVIRDFWEAFGRTEVRVRPAPPAPGAIDRMDETFTWLRWLEPEETRLVWLRAEGVVWKLITYRLGVCRSTAWRQWVAALIKVASRLNGIGDRNRPNIKGASASTRCRRTARGVHSPTPGSP